MIKYLDKTACFFDIEFVPDLELGRRVFNLSDKVKDETVLHTMRSNTYGYDRKTNPLPVMKNAFYKVVSISCVTLKNGTLKLRTLPSTDNLLQMSEAEILKTFLTWVGDEKPQLFSWAGTGFDLPIMRTRAIANDLVLPSFFFRPETPYKGIDFNTRFANDHNIDLQELLANTHRHSLHEMARTLNVPGKFGLEGGDVADTYYAGRIDEVRDYNETDAATTFLVAMKYMRSFGTITEERYTALIDQFHGILVKQSEVNKEFKTFLEIWGYTPKQQAETPAQPEGAKNENESGEQDAQ